MALEISNILTWSNILVPKLAYKVRLTIVLLNMIVFTLGFPVLAVICDKGDVV